MLNSVNPSASPQADLETQSATRGHPQEGMDLRRGSFADRWEAAKHIPQGGEPAIADLVTILNDGSLPWEARWFAARSLGSFATPTVITALIEALGTADGNLDQDLQAAIIAALSQIGPSAIAALSDLLTQPTHQSVAIEALTRIPHPATQAPLVTAVGLTAGANRAKVIEALGQFADLELLPLLTEALQDRASTVRLAALQGLLHLKKQVEEPLWVGWIQPLVGDVHPAVAQRAIHALGRTTDPSATQTLQSWLEATHTPELLKVATAQALAWQGTAAALEVLIHSWEPLPEAVQIAMLQGLSRLSDPRLKARLSDPVQGWLKALPPTPEHSLLRRNLVLLLGQVGEDPVGPILQTFRRDPDAGVRLHAEAALRSRPYTKSEFPPRFPTSQTVGANRIRPSEPGVINQD